MFSLRGILDRFKLDLLNEMNCKVSGLVRDALWLTQSVLDLKFPVVLTQHLTPNRISHSFVWYWSFSFGVRLTLGAKCVLHHTNQYLNNSPVPK